MFTYIFNITKWLIIADYHIESFIKNKIFKTTYMIEGACSQCGKCCEVIGVSVPDYLVKIRWLLIIVITFYEKVNNFKYQEYSLDHHALLFSCNNYDYENKACLSYKKRPAICRSYPSVRYFNKPVLLPMCSFKVELNIKKNN